MSLNHSRSTWGRARFGGGSAALITVSLLCGAITSVGVSYLFAAIRFSDHQPIAWLIFSLAFLPVFTAVFYAIFVDRSTLRDTPTDPEASIEATWYKRAASGAFTDMIGLLGIALLAFTLFVDLSVSVDTVLLVLIVVAMLDFGIRYLIIRRREG